MAKSHYEFSNTIYVSYLTAYIWLKGYANTIYKRLGGHMPNQTSTAPDHPYSFTVQLRSYKLRNRRLLRHHSGPAANRERYEREETDIA